MSNAPATSVATDLDLRGMTCASCAARVERGLNELTGVRASVNFAVERAHVEHDPDVSVAQLVAAVEATGYHAAPVRTPGDDAPAEEIKEVDLRPRLIGSAVLSVPVVVLSMVMAW
ncbi:MAG: carbonate dehydratase, partial [Mycobacterium sp.]|nr:carbonate dehydratase [Mycobacterium sp.]